VLHTVVLNVWFGLVPLNMRWAEVPFTVTEPRRTGSGHRDLAAAGNKLKDSEKVSFCGKVKLTVGIGSEGRDIDAPREGARIGTKLQNQAAVPVHIL
jgi:hypothetical protein